MSKVFYVSHVLQAKDIVYLDGDFLPDAKVQIGDCLMHDRWKLKVTGISSGLKRPYPKKEVTTLQTTLIQGDSTLLGALISQSLEKVT